LKSDAFSKQAVEFGKNRHISSLVMKRGVDPHQFNRKLNPAKFAARGKIENLPKRTTLKKCQHNKKLLIKKHVMAHLKNI